MMLRKIGRRVVRAGKAVGIEMGGESDVNLCRWHILCSIKHQV